MKATQAAVKAVNRHKRRQQTSVNVNRVVAAAVMVVCMVGNRGGGRAAMLRGWVANALGGFWAQEGTWTIHWQKICGIAAASQGVNHFLCWRCLARELWLDFCLLSAHLV